MKNKIIVIAMVLLMFGMVIIILLNVSYPIKYSTYVKEYAKEYNLDISMVCAVIKVESGFNPKAKSKVGAMGLMQILPTTAEDIASRLGDAFSLDKLYDPKTNIRYGCYYLRYLIDMFGDMYTAISAYNAGLSNVRNWLKDNRYSTDGVTLVDIPFRETREYIVKIKRAMKVYGYKIVK